MAKVVGEQCLTIVTDFLGVPVGMYDDSGTEVWSASISGYGKLRNLSGVEGLDELSMAAACPFRWPGQYEDVETGLSYNRFRYYDSDIGHYLSKDPIQLEGGFKLYGYVHDPLTWTDPLGLSAAKTCGADPSADDLLNEALRQQGLDVPPARMKQTWTDPDTKIGYEVRIHPANPDHGKTGSIYRVQRARPGVDKHGQGLGKEYADPSGGWHHTSTLKPNSSTYNADAARDTHIQL